MNMAETELRSINGWVARVDNRLDKMSESIEKLGIAIAKLEGAIDRISDGQKRYLTADSFDHQKVLKDVADIDERLRDLKRISNERQEIVDKSNTYMKKVDELESNLRRVWKSFAWAGGILVTIAVAVIIKWIETIYFRPGLYEHTKQALSSLTGVML